MADEASREYLARERELKRGKVQADFDQYMADLARQYRIARQGSEANLEARGILRSGEGNVARIRMSEAQRAAEQAAQTNREYNENIIDIDYMRQLAALQGAGGGTSGGGGTTPTAPATTPPATTTPVVTPPAQTPPATTRPVVTTPATTSRFVDPESGRVAAPAPLTAGGVTAPRQTVTLPAGIDFGALAAAMKPKPKPVGGASGGRLR